MLPPKEKYFFCAHMSNSGFVLEQSQNFTEIIDSFGSILQLFIFWLCAIFSWCIFMYRIISILNFEQLFWIV